MEAPADGHKSIVFAVTSPTPGFAYSVVWCKKRGSGQA
jgi:hypothetical protein